MACRRKGLGKGKGMGYKNLIPKDKVVHKQSAKGMKQPQSRTRKAKSKKPIMPRKVIFPMPTAKAMQKIEKVAQSEYLTNQQTEQLKKFFRKRFPHHFQGDYLEEMYAKTWARRFASGHAQDYADTKSSKVLKEVGYQNVQKPREIMKLERVAYSKKSTPIHLREYQLSPNSPVGTLKEYEELLDGENVKLDVGLTMAEKKKVTKMAKLIDTDGDGVADILDCQPQNPDRQDDFEDIDEFTDRVANKPSLGTRLSTLGKQGVKYVSDLNKARVEKRDAFEAEITNLNDKQLRELAVRHRDTGIFFSGNPYEDELVRREKERHQINRRLNEERQRAKEDANKESGGFF